MTDNDIIKALECCTCNTMNDCDDCPHFVDNDKSTYDCMIELMCDALDLINRQKAENERLNGCVKSENEIREIMESQLFSVVEELTNTQMERVAHISRKEGILDVFEWLSSLFPKNMNYVMISKFAVKKQYEEMVGDENES